MVWAPAGAELRPSPLNRGVVNDDVTSVDVKAASSTVSEVKCVSNVIVPPPTTEMPEVEPAFARLMVSINIGSPDGLPVVPYHEGLMVMV